MKFSSLLLICCIPMMSLSEEKAPKVTDGYTYDRSTSTFNHSTRSSSEFNTDGTIKSRTTYNIENGAEVAQSEIRFTYDSQGKLAYWEKGNIVGGVFNFSRKMTLTRDASGNIIVEKWQEHSGEDWDDATRATYIYNGDKKTSRTTQKREGTGWTNQIRIEYIYFEDGKLEEEQVSAWNSVSFKQSSRNRFEYNADNDISISTTDIFIYGSWNPFQKYNYSYLEKGIQTRSTEAIWNGAAFIDAQRYSTKFRKIALQILLKDEMNIEVNMNGAYGETQSAQKQALLDTVWVPTWKEIYTYETNTDVLNQKQAITSFNLECNYPNPFNPSTTIVFTLTENTEIAIDIFDMRGRRVVNLANGRFSMGRHSLQFNAEDLPSGNYICRLKSGGQVQIRKMMLVK
ncbi:T9SS type A sorting domain-containing protein [bacterium]|nr:T9SS type A sorting domain-containing protein [bacterium]